MLRVVLTEAIKTDTSKTKHKYKEHMQPPYWLMYPNMALSPPLKVSTEGKKVKKDNSNEPYDPSKINSLLIIPTEMNIFNRILYGKSRHQMENDGTFKATVT